MNKIPTPHIGAKASDIAKTVIMPGDPLRAKFIAENFLTDAVCFNTVRNMLGFTGIYKNKKVSVMASGMGVASMGIYSYELFNFYKVDNIIRIGTAGAIFDKLKLKDIILAMGACTNSNYASQYNLPGIFAPIADFELLNKTYQTALENKLKVHVGNVLSSDIFYYDDNATIKKWLKMGVLATEMESAGLYMNASRASKKALSILSVSDYIFKEESLSSKERQESLNSMVKLALKTAQKL